MQQRFHIFVQHHFHGWYTGHVLTHPDYAVYAPTMKQLRQELHDVLARELALKHLVAKEEETFFDPLKQHPLRLELNAVQNERLVRVPLRLTLLEHALKEKDLYELWIPRLGKRFRIFDHENIIPWSEEIIRGFFHLKPVEELIGYQYERNERIEELEVTYHGAGRYKHSKSRRWQEDDDLSSLFSSGGALAEVGVNLTQEAEEGRLQRAYFRDYDINQISSILAGHQQRSVLLLGPSGVGKSALVHELAARIVAGQVPERLQDTPIWYVTGSRIIAGMKYLGEWQQRCLQIVEEVRSQQGILYIDGLLEVMMSGSLRSGLNVAQMLLPFLQKDDLIVIAEATPDALAMAEQLNSPFVQTFRRFPVPSFTPDKAFAILERSARKLGKENKVLFTPPSIQRALDTLARFGDADALPGSGLRLIEQMARLYPPSPTRRELEAQDAIRAFSRSSGFPEALIDPDQDLDVEGVKEFFDQRVVGQPHAMERLTNLVMLIKASLNDPRKPLGSFLFMGPTGVGKTESVLTLAEYLFQDRKRLIRMDMSEYAAPGSAMRLVGGIDGEGDLTRKVREQPFSIVLLDEVEKADPSVFDVLLQVLGEGRLTDTTGSTLAFTHTIVIMTSNLGAEQKAPPGFGGRTTQAIEGHYREAAERFFRPEFINRIDFLVPFHPLDRDALRKIAQMMLDKALQREGFLRRNVTLTYDDQLLDALVERGYQPKYGARPMKRAIEQTVLVPLSRRLIRRPDSQPETFQLTLDQGQLILISDRGLHSPLPLPLRDVQLRYDNLWERRLGELHRRMQIWEATSLYHQLREEQHPLIGQFRGVHDALLQLEELSGRRPSQLDPEAQDRFRQQAHALDKERLELEWSLCTETFQQTQPPENQTLCVHSPDLQPSGLRLMIRMTEAYKKLAQALDIKVQIEEEQQRITLRFEGPLAALFDLERGRHRLLQEEGQYVDLFVTAEAEDPPPPKAEQDDEPPEDRVRDITEQPTMMTDPLTNLELPQEITDASQPLRLFLLARLAHRLST